MEPPAVGTRSLRRAERRSEARRVGRRGRGAPAVGRRRSGRRRRSGVRPVRLGVRRSVAASGLRRRVRVRRGVLAADRIAPAGRRSRCPSGSADGRRSCDQRLQLPGQRGDVRGGSGTRAPGRRRPGRARAAPFEERPGVGLTPGDDGGGEPVPPHLGEQVGTVPVTTISLRPPHGQGGDQVGQRRRVPLEQRAGQRDRALDTASSSLGSSTKRWPAAARRRRWSWRRARHRRGTPWAGRRAPRRRGRSRRTPRTRRPRTGRGAGRPTGRARSRQTPLPGPLGQTDAGLDQPGVVRRDGQMPRPAALPAAHQPAVRRTWRPEEFADLLGAAAVVARCRWLPPPRPGWRRPWRSTP